MDFLKLDDCLFKEKLVPCVQQLIRQNQWLKARIEELQGQPGTLSGPQGPGNGAKGVKAPKEHPSTTSAKARHAPPLTDSEADKYVEYFEKGEGYRREGLARAIGIEKEAAGRILYWLRNRGLTIWSDEKNGDILVS